MPQKFVEFKKFEQRCDKLLEQDEIRFAGLINNRGKLVSGGLKKGVTPLEDDVERQKMYMELALRVSMRMEFDYCLGPVKYSASRREKAVMMSFPINNKVFFISAETWVDIEKLAKKIMLIISVP